MNKWQRRYFIVGAVAAVLCLLGAAAARQQFFISYLFAFLFWFSLAIGALGLRLLHQLTGGAWGDLIEPQLKAAARSLPFVALLFIPILVGLKVLYPWAQPALVAVDPVLQHKHIYLNIPFFCFRTVFYFGAWSLMAYKSTRRTCAPSLILYVLTLSFAAIDWMMSIEPHWYSTIYGVLLLVASLQSALAFVTVGLRILQNPHGHTDAHFLKPYLDLGNMLLALVMFWAYVSFSQYLIIWSANLPEEIPWYLSRQKGGWFVLAMVLVVGQFVLPFLVLLGRRNKQKLERLAWVAAFVAVLGVLNMYWFIQPAFFPGGFHLHWLDAAAFAAVGGIWMGLFVTALQKQPAPVGTYAPETNP